MGVRDTADNIKNISLSLQESIGLCIEPHPFYKNQYSNNNELFHYLQTSILLKYVYHAALFSYAAFVARGFFWIGSKGFLAGDRVTEHKILKWLKKKQVVLFCGTEIRSPRLMSRIEKETKEENIASYLKYINPSSNKQKYEIEKKKTAQIAEKYNDLIFTAAIDQAGYFKKKTESFFYVYPDKKFSKNTTKFRDCRNPIILHAPSSPIIKGTPLVRAAIKKLSIQGYKFRYQEIIGVSNKQVIRSLKKAHIVLNEFYAFVPGLFGIEAMANYCCLLTGADERLEPELPKGSNQAWLVTRYYEIYDHLKRVLNHPELMISQAEAGYQWALEHAAISKTGPQLQKKLESIPDNIG